MDRPFILLLAAAVLIGGALTLWFFPNRGSAPITEPISISSTGPVSGEPGPSMHAVLAVSWEPAFCEGASRKAECRSQTVSRFDATHFSLHGLWPDDQYCDVSGSLEDADRASRWFDLPPVELSSATEKTLDQMMPGSQSGLDRHEWLKHGTCSGVSADAYFTRAMSLLGEINASPLRDLFVAKSGQSVSFAEIASAIDAGFGPGTSDRVSLACNQDGSRRLATELTFELSGDVMGIAPLRKIAAAGHLVQNDCEQAIVDRVGLQ